MGEADDAAGDLRAAGLLLALYTLQGIPMGLSGAVPLLLAGRASYAEQALLSLASLPFSLKLLWAPLVDAASPRWAGARRGSCRRSCSSARRCPPGARRRVGRRRRVACA